MTIAELRERIALMRETGVLELADGHFRAVLGAPVGVPTATKVQRDDPPEVHPADLVANPPEILRDPLVDV